MINRGVKAAERMLDRIWRSEVERINEHLPREFKSLSELLKSQTPHVTTRSGSPLILDREELELIAKIAPKKLHEKIRLPIVLLRRLDLGRGVFQVLGGKAEAYVVLKILGEKRAEEIGESDLPLYLYKPQVFKLKKALRTCTVIGFSFTSEFRSRISLGF